ncbi:MAG: hypothetical protein QXP36_07770 [Conexivisphaerales archaeon]
MLDNLIKAYGDGKIKVKVSKTHNAQENLEEESRLFLSVEAKTISNALFFWMNDECLVRGQVKSQKYGWYDEQLAQELGIPVYQRTTGGGVVYHDRGNLNWSIIFSTSGKVLSPEKIFSNGSRFVIKALKNLGFQAAFAAPNRIEIDGKKISGMAARSGISSLLVHGTLLIDSNLERLNMLCKPPVGYPPVANLSEWRDDISVDKIIENIIGVFQEEGFIVQPS